MSVKQFPEPGAEKQFPFGTNGSFTFDNTVDSGVYEVNVTGDDSFAASANALTISATAGYTVAAHLDTGEGYVAIPWDGSNTVNAASIATPTVVSLKKVKYEMDPPIEGLSVSFDPGLSGSYVIDGTIGGTATSVQVFYAEGVTDIVAASALPASVSSFSYDYDDAFSSSVLSMAISYLDEKGIFSRSVSTVETFPTPSGAFAQGGTTSNDGVYRYHTFTGNGTLTTDISGDAEYIIIAGGGGGGGSNPGTLGAGGGGAGGFVSGSLTLSGSYAITIGGGGAAGIQRGGGFPPTSGSSGGTTTLGAVATATGGGGGGSAPSGGGGSGGSGGGAGRSSSSAGSASPAGQGFPGGIGTAGTTGGGGGGAGEAGNTDGNGHGGDGTNAYSTWATTTGTGDSGYYAGGGGGGAPTTGAPGGLGGGGGGNPSGANGTANTGGGGGGGYSTAGRTGGSGLVIIRYPL